MINLLKVGITTGLVLSLFSPYLFSTGVALAACTNITPVSYSVSPDLGNYTLSLKGPFSVSVNGLEPGNSYYLGIRSSTGTVIVDQHRDYTSTTDGFVSPQRTFQGTSVTFSNLNSSGHPLNLQESSVYAVAVYTFINRDSPLCQVSQNVTFTNGAYPGSQTLGSCSPYDKNFNASAGTATLSFQNPRFSGLGGRGYRITDQSGESGTFSNIQNFTAAQRTGNFSLTFSGLSQGQNIAYGFEVNGLTPPFSCQDSFYFGSVTSPTAGKTGGGISNPNPCTTSGGQAGVDTAFGCIPVDIGGFANSLFSIALGIAGALAIMFIIIGGFKVATSQGDPDSLQDGRDMITHAIIGLVFILLATTILSIIGIDILGLSAFTRNGAGIIINQ